MKLRSYKFLKYFAILLFSFELIAPALITSGNAGVRLQDEDQTSLTSETSHLANLMSSLVFEETSSEEERETKDHKTSLSFSDFGSVQLFVELTSLETRQNSWIEKVDRCTSQPPLFTMIHSYRI